MKWLLTVHLQESLTSITILMTISPSPLRKTIKPRMDLFSSPRAEVRLQLSSLLLLWLQTPHTTHTTSQNASVLKMRWTSFVDSAAPFDLIISSRFASLPFLISRLSFCYPVRSFTLRQCSDLSPLSFSTSHLYSRHTLCIKQQENYPNCVHAVLDISTFEAF